MKNAAIWSAFDAVYCLTLDGDIERQRSASKELCDVGLRAFRFIEGVPAHSAEVRAAYRDGKVASFPPCFRCGEVSCGLPDCNNVLIEPQVGCFLSFLKVFRIALSSGLRTFFFVEDDIKFHSYFAKLAAAALDHGELEKLGFFSDEPCLIGLGRGLLAQDEARTFSDRNCEFLSRRRMPQNPCFAFNRAFAEFAITHFTKIDHTSDVYIHINLAEKISHHHSLEPPLAYELSASKGLLPSRIHPKRLAFENEANPTDVREEAQRAFDAHLNHVKHIPLAVIGSPRGGTGFMAHALRRCGLQIGHERMDEDGISSWLFAVNDTSLPFGVDKYARNSKFVFADKTIAVLRTSPRAIYSTIVENTKNIQSYAFRRRWIKREFGIDLDDFRTEFERAIAAYVFWTRIVMSRDPHAWVCLERAEQDIPRLFSAGILTANADVTLEGIGLVNHRKPYFGQTYEVPVGDFACDLSRSDPAVREEYERLRNDLPSLFSESNPSSL